MISTVENKMEQEKRAESFSGEVKNALPIITLIERLTFKQNFEGRESWECGYKKKKLSQQSEHPMQKPQG